MTCLDRLILGSREPDSEVARRWDSVARHDDVITWSDFREDVASLCLRLQKEPKGSWVVLTEDAYCLAVSLFSLWHSGCYAISPPNRQVDSLRRLQTRAVGSLCDRADWITEGLCLHPIQGRSSESRSFSFEPMDPDGQAIELYTSGTTGGEKPVLKKISHLQDEISEIDSLWGDRCSGATFFSTASHQHLYGLLFGVLWPLVSGQVFHARHYLHSGEVVSRMLAAGDAVLVSVPTHLRRLAHHARVRELSGTCRIVFSSGGPLASETAHVIDQKIGNPPLEVLGSTETGGIAWRSQRPGEESEAWTAFPSVEVARDEASGAMRVRSPFVSIGSRDEGYATGDRILLDEQGGFLLLGRMDQVAKVGEKRVDLARMESDLRQHDFIDEVALASLDRDPVTRIAAAIVPSESGRLFLEREGRRSFGSEIRTRLFEAWDPIMHPRYWRIVEQLPEDSVGKVKRSAVIDLFNRSEVVEPSGDRPAILEELSGSDFVERFCVVPQDLGCFKGHFPGNPMVPGVLQLDWALGIATGLLGEEPQVQIIESLKFSSILRPLDEVRINVRSKGNRLYIRLWNDEAEFSKGRILLAPGNQDRGDIS